MEEDTKEGTAVAEEVVVEVVAGEVEAAGTVTGFALTLGIFFFLLDNLLNHHAFS